MVLILVGIAWGVAVSLVTGGEVGVFSSRVFTGQDITTARPEDFQIVSTAVPWWSWLTPIAASTLAYLAVSGLIIGARHPWLWLAGIWLVVMMTGTFADELEWEGVLHLMHVALGNGAWFGLLTAVTGTVETVVSVSEQGHAVYAPRPNAGAWLAATALWMTIAVAASWAAVQRHREA